MTSKDEWQTPPELFKKLNDEFTFAVDVACNEKNCLCPFGTFGEGLEHDWQDFEFYKEGYCYDDNDKPQYTYEHIITCFMNPPFSKPNLYNFCKKAYEEYQKGCVVVGLLPLDCSTKQFEEFIWKADEIRFVTKRIRFINPETQKPVGSPTFSSIIVVWRYKENVDEPPKVSLWSY